MDFTRAEMNNQGDTPTLGGHASRVEVLENVFSRLADAAAAAGFVVFFFFFLVSGVLMNGGED